MKTILLLAILALSANASAREYDVVCKWTDGTKETYSRHEVWTASANQYGTSIQLNDGTRIEYSNSVQCKIVGSSE